MESRFNLTEASDTDRQELQKETQALLTAFEHFRTVDPTFDYCVQHFPWQDLTQVMGELFQKAGVQFEPTCKIPQDIHLLSQEGFKAFGWPDYEGFYNGCIDKIGIRVLPNMAVKNMLLRNRRPHTPEDIEEVKRIKYMVAITHEYVHAAISELIHIKSLPPGQAPEGYSVQGPGTLTEKISGLQRTTTEVYPLTDGTSLQHISVERNRYNEGLTQLIAIRIFDECNRRTGAAHEMRWDPVLVNEIRYTFRGSAVQFVETLASAVAEKIGIHQQTVLDALINAYIHRLQITSDAASEDAGLFTELFGKEFVERVVQAEDSTTINECTDMLRQMLASDHIT